MSQTKRSGSRRCELAFRPLEWKAARHTLRISFTLELAAHPLSAKADEYLFRVVEGYGSPIGRRKKDGTHDVAADDELSAQVTPEAKMFVLRILGQSDLVGIVERRQFSDDSRGFRQ